MKQIPVVRQAWVFLFLTACAAGVPMRADVAEARGSGLPPPSRYSAVSSAVLQYRWFRFPALGVITVDVPARRFALVGLSQMGINVFELSESGGRLRSRMPGRLLDRRPEIVSGAAADVRQMFFEQSPLPDARRVSLPGDRMEVYRQPDSSGILEFRIDRKSGYLVEKRHFVSWKVLPGASVDWLVRYGGYTAIGGYSYPREIRFKQRRLDYAITLFLKELRVRP